MDHKTSRRRPSRVWFADEIPGRLLVEIVEVECLKAEFAPELWSSSFYPLWSCRECTFVNEKPDALACLVCGTPRWENDNPQEYLDRLAVRTSRRQHGSGRPKSPSARGKVASTFHAEVPVHAVKARPGTPVNRSASCGSRMERRSEIGAEMERPEIQFRESMQMSRPQASAKTSAVRASSTSSVGRHETSSARPTKSTKDTAGQRLLHRRVTESMAVTESLLHSLQTGSSRASQSNEQAPLKTPSHLRRLDLDGLPSLDLPPIGLSPCPKIQSIQAHQQHEQLYHLEASPQTFALSQGSTLTLGRRPDSSRF